MSIGQTQGLFRIKMLSLVALLSVSTVMRAEPVTSLKQASEIAQQSYGGQVVKAEESVIDEKKVYVIRVIHEGRVRDVVIDPEDGHVVNP